MARNFTFRGEVLLRLRRQRERAARVAFARARDEADAIQARIAELQAALAQYHDAARAAVMGGGRKFDVGLYRRCVGDIAAALADQRARLAAAQETQRRCRDELAEATSQYKAVKCLKEKLLSRHERQVDRSVVKERDDQHATHAAARGRIDMWEDPTK